MTRYSLHKTPTAGSNSGLPLPAHGSAGLAALPGVGPRVSRGLGQVRAQALKSRGPHHVLPESTETGPDWTVLWAASALLPSSEETAAAAHGREVMGLRLPGQARH